MTNCSPTSLRWSLIRARMRGQKGRSIKGDGHLLRKAIAPCPFAHAGAGQSAQRNRADLAGATRMLRLLQGDVGSGKTVVALLAMATRGRGGRQAR
jgi:ATP-dependent DNA helicase RecG